MKLYPSVPVDSAFAVLHFIMGTVFTFLAAMSFVASWYHRRRVRRLVSEGRWN